MWQAPVDNGNRSDIFYTISQNVTSTTFNTTDTSITLTGLTPFVYYEIRVTADNGVSSQSNDVKNRSETFPILTLPGGNCVCMCACCIILLYVGGLQHLHNYLVTYVHKVLKYQYNTVSLVNCII